MGVIIFVHYNEGLIGKNNEDEGVQAHFTTRIHDALTFDTLDDAHRYAKRISLSPSEYTLLRLAARKVV